MPNNETQIDYDDCGPAMHRLLATLFPICRSITGDGVRQTLDTLRHRLDDWMRETGDRGPECGKMYDSDMAVYLKKPSPVVEENVKLNKQWAKEGK